MEKEDIKLARVLQKAADIHEMSYDHEAANQIEKAGTVTDFEKFYRKSLKEASIEAVAQMGLVKTIAYPVSLLLRIAWNDSLEWAEIIHPLLIRKEPIMNPYKNCLTTCAIIDETCESCTEECSRAGNRETKTTPKKPLAPQSKGE